MRNTTIQTILVDHISILLKKLE